jgi:hypothetical protein
MLTVMLGFQTYHQWSEHLWEHHAENERDEHDCDLCDWNLAAFLNPGSLETFAIFQNVNCDFLVVFSEGGQDLFFGSHSGRGPPLV